MPSLRATVLFYEHTRGIKIEKNKGTKNFEEVGETDASRSSLGVAPGRVIVGDELVAYVTDRTDTEVEVLRTGTDTMTTDQSTKTGRKDLDELHSALLEQQDELQKQLSALTVESPHQSLSQGSVPYGLSEELLLSDEEINVTMTPHSLGNVGTLDETEGTATLIGTTDVQSTMSGQRGSAIADPAVLSRQNAVEATGTSSEVAGESCSGRGDGKAVDQPIPDKPEAKAMPAATKGTPVGGKESAKDKKAKTKEQKAKDGYKRACSFLRKFEGKDSSLLSEREMGLIKTNFKTVARFERDHLDLSKKRDFIDSIPLLKGLKSDTSTAVVTAGAKEDKTVTAPKKGITELSSKAKTAIDSSKKEDRFKPTQESRKRVTSNPKRSTTLQQTQGKSKTPSKSTSCVKRVRSNDEPQPAAKRHNARTATGLGKSASTSSHQTSQKGKAVPTGNTLKRKISGDSAQSSAKSAGNKGITGSVGDHKVAIIDRADADGKISPERWLQLEEKLMEAMLSDRWSGSDVLFDGAAWQRGVKIIGCANKESLNFLKCAVSEIGEAWPGAQLEIVPMSAIPLRPMASVWIPPPIKDTEKILKLIGKQNAGLRTDSWVVVSSSVCAENGGLNLRVRLSAESEGFLRSCEGRVRLGFGTIRFRLPNPGERNSEEAAHSAN